MQTNRNLNPGWFVDYNQKPIRWSLNGIGGTTPELLCKSMIHRTLTRKVRREKFSQ